MTRKSPIRFAAGNKQEAFSWGRELGAGIAVQKTLRFLKVEDTIKSMYINSPLVDKFTAFIWLFFEYQSLANTVFIGTRLDLLSGPWADQSLA